MKCDYLVVGAGFFGTVVAEMIASDLNVKVLVIDKRAHIGGNCYSEYDQETEIEYHIYGTHIFHTNLRRVWEYINRFTEFNGYYHQVLTTFNNKVYQMPINLETINSFYNRNLTPTEAKEFIDGEIRKEGITQPKNLEEKAVSLIGRPLYEAFIKGYTIKQWNKDPKKLPESIIARLPIRYNYREDYFNNSRWQGIPLNGYTKVFERMMDNPNILVKLNTDYFAVKDSICVRKKTIYTGPVDQYFNYEYGRLDWRTVNLERILAEVEDYQGTSVMNIADIDNPCTRIHEPRHLHPERNYTDKKTIYFKETSDSIPDKPYYPINTERNQKLLQQYLRMALDEKHVIFGGRLGNYAYYDMDITIDKAIECFLTEIKGK